MKTLTKSLLAASLGMAAVTANAAILNDSTGDSEPWLSVYDSTSKQTFTYDLGNYATARDLFDNAKNPDYSLSVDLSPFADWNTFKGIADLSTTQYSVFSIFQDTDFSHKLMVTGTDDTKFVGSAFNDFENIRQSLEIHANNINADTASGVIKIGGSQGLLQETSTVNDADGNRTGQHNAGGGSKNMYGSATYDPDADYGTSNPMQLAELNVTTFAGEQTQFVGEWLLDGDLLTYSAAPIPVPAAVWMFGSALFGLMGVRRKLQTA